MFSIPGIATIVLLTIGLTTVIKRAAKLKTDEEKRWIPLIAILLGIILVFLGRQFVDINYYSIGTIILVGIAVGLESVGLFSSAKNTFPRKKPLDK